MKKVFLLFVLVSFCSCNTSLQKEVNRLQKENDSLVKIADWVKDKYVFDAVRLKTIDDYSNTNIIGTTHGQEHVFIAYNKDPLNCTMLFSDTVVRENKSIDLISPKTLTFFDGGFRSQLKIDKRITSYYIQAETKSLYGKAFKSYMRMGYVGYTSDKEKDTILKR